MSAWRQIKRLFVHEPSRARTLATIDLSNTARVESYRAILREMAQIVRDNGYEHEARVADEVLSYLDTDAELFSKSVGGIWGKDGVLDCQICSNVPVGDVRAISKAFKQRQRLYELAAMLIGKLQADGMYYPQLEGEGKWYAELAGKVV